MEIAECAIVVEGFIRASHRGLFLAQSQQAFLFIGVFRKSKTKINHDLETAAHLCVLYYGCNWYWASVDVVGLKKNQNQLQRIQRRKEKNRERLKQKNEIGVQLS